MGLNITKIAGKIAGPGISGSQALALVDAAVNLIDFVEDIYEGLKGSEKFAAVKAALKTTAENLGILDDFERLWAILGPLVSLIVTINNLKGLWKRAT